MGNHWMEGDIWEYYFSKYGLWNYIINLIWELVDMQIIRPHLKPIKLKKCLGVGLVVQPASPGDSDAS